MSFALLWLLGTALGVRPVFASAPEPAWVIVSREGQDLQGRSDFDRFELTPDGLVRWETSATGAQGAGGCGRGAGTFEGRAAADDGDRLGRLARAALDSQPAGGSAASASSIRRANATLFLSRGGQVRQAEVTSSTSRWDGLQREVLRLESSLTPRAVVVMYARRVGTRRLRVRFDWLGDQPALLFLPPLASTVFSAEGYRVRYAKPPGEEEVRMGFQKRHAEVELVVEPESRARSPLRMPELRYSNAPELHHASGEPLLGDLAPVPMNLCAAHP